MPPNHLVVLRILVVLGLAGSELTAWGLVRLEVRPTIFGTTLLVVAQLWRIDQFGRLWERVGQRDRVITG